MPRGTDLHRAGGAHAIALVLAALAVALRSCSLGTQPLWFDEALTAHIAHAPNGLDFVHNTPPLYHWLSRWWSHWFGIGPAGLRSLSAVAGALFVWLSFQVARAAFGPRTAVIAALVALLSPLHLYYSQEARAYALLLDALLLAQWMLWRVVEGQGRGSWILLVLASVAALYTHYLAAIPLALGYLAAWLPSEAAMRWRAAKSLAAAGLSAVALLLPWLLWWRAHTPFEPRDMQWLAVLWERLAGGRAFAATAEMFVLGAQAEHAPVFLKQFSVLSFPEPLRVAGLAAAALLLVLGVGRTLARGGGERRALAQCLAIAVGSAACLWLVSLVRPVYCPGRYDLIAFPAFVLVLAHAIAVATSAASRAVRALAVVAAAGLAVAVATKDWRYLTAPASGDANVAAAEYLRDHIASGEAVVLTGSVGLPVLARLYCDDFVWVAPRCRSARGDVEFSCRLLPPSLEQAPGATSRYLRAVEDGSLVADLRQLELPADATGIWLLLPADLHGAEADPARTAVARRLFAVLHERGFDLAGGAPELGAAHLLPRQPR